MNNFIEQLVKIERELSTSVGDFTLFGAFQPEEAGLPNRWDIVVSFPDSEIERETKMKKIIDYFQNNLDVKYLLNISRIQYVKPNENFVKLITDDVSLKHSKKEVINDNLKRLGIKHAYVISSNQSKAA